MIDNIDDINNADNIEPGQEFINGLPIGPKQSPEIRQKIADALMHLGSVNRERTTINLSSKETVTEVESVLPTIAPARKRPVGRPKKIRRVVAVAPAASVSAQDNPTEEPETEAVVAPVTKTKPKTVATTATQPEIKQLQIELIKLQITALSLQLESLRDK